ncbi:hypothetical protein E2C01_028848 [Portunus trituberculatus]|uniref:Uncharacterized protein n=1 Tax=Portunus trituberculatus TaxID=210409 RepID=A0A5B7EQC2_PORTR|nr:hypothetical protein [Portunus trituberculatus]
MNHSRASPRVLQHQGSGGGRGQAGVPSVMIDSVIFYLVIKPQLLVQVPRLNWDGQVTRPRSAAPSQFKSISILEPATFFRRRGRGPLNEPIGGK